MSEDERVHRRWLAPDRKWYSPEELATDDWYVGRHAKWSPVGGRRVPYDYPVIAAGSGWALLILSFMFVGFASDAGDTCALSGPRGYQACVREEELAMVVPSLIALGLSFAAMIGALRGLRERGDRGVFRTALALSVALVGPSLLLGFLADSFPQSERELTYVGLSNTSVGVAAAVAATIGSIVGVLLPVKAPRSATHRSCGRGHGKWARPWWLE